MKLRWPWLIRILAAVVSFFIWCWFRTMRLRIASADGREHPVAPEDGRVIYCFWHEAMLAPLASGARVQMLISQHADGEFIALVCQWLGYAVLRGSSTRGGCGAMLTMIREQPREFHLAITPDGPRGPRREFQPGAVLVASQTGVPIVPLGVGFTSAWRANSWDQFCVPWPFSTQLIFVGQPIHIPPDLDRPGIERERQRVEAGMRATTELAEDWAARLARDGSALPPPPALPAEDSSRRAA